MELKIPRPAPKLVQLGAMSTETVFGIVAAEACYDMLDRLKLTNLQGDLALKLNDLMVNLSLNQFFSKKTELKAAMFDHDPVINELTTIATQRFYSIIGHSSPAHLSIAASVLKTNQIVFGGTPYFSYTEEQINKMVGSRWWMFVIYFVLMNMDHSYVQQFVPPPEPVPGSQSNRR